MPKNRTWIPDTTAVNPVLLCFCFNDLKKLVQTNYQQYNVFAFFLKKYFETTFDTHTHAHTYTTIIRGHNRQI